MCASAGTHNARIGAVAAVVAPFRPEPVSHDHDAAMALRVHVAPLLREAVLLSCRGRHGLHGGLSDCLGHHLLVRREGVVGHAGDVHGRGQLRELSVPSAARNDAVHRRVVDVHPCGLRWELRVQHGPLFAHPALESPDALKSSAGIADDLIVDKGASERTRMHIAQDGVENMTYIDDAPACQLNRLFTRSGLCNVQFPEEQKQYNIAVVCHKF